MAYPSEAHADTGSTNPHTPGYHPDDGTSPLPLYLAQTPEEQVPIKFSSLGRNLGSTRLYPLHADAIFRPPVVPLIHPRTGKEDRNILLARSNLPLVPEGVGIDPRLLMLPTSQDAFQTKDESAPAPRLGVERTTDRLKFQCEICNKRFDRACRRESCRNRHAGTKPHVCGGRCGVNGCPKGYSSIEYLSQHINGCTTCQSCGESRSSQNMARRLKQCK